MKQSITGLMACDLNGVIGKDGSIPWSCAEDTQYFRDMTLGETLITGRKTFSSLPKHLLNDRVFLVFSRSVKADGDKNCTFIRSIAEFIKLRDTAAFESKSCLYMVGGAEIASLFLKNDLINEFILTVINSAYDGDTKLDIHHFQNWAKETLFISAEFSRFKYSKQNLC